MPHLTEAWTEICDAVLAAGITDAGRYSSAVTTLAQHAAWAVVEPLLTERPGGPDQGRPGRQDDPGQPGASR